MSKLRENYNAACNEYLKAFCEKHDFNYHDAKECWVGGDIGGITMCGDFYVSLTDIIVDIDHDAPKDEYLKYYDYALSCSECGINSPNYFNWLRGCPRLTEERLAAIKEAKRKIEFAQKDFERCIAQQNDFLLRGL